MPTDQTWTKKKCLTTLRLCNKNDFTTFTMPMLSRIYVPYPHSFITVCFSAATFLNPRSFSDVTATSPVLYPVYARLTFFSGFCFYYIDNTPSSFSLGIWLGA